MFQKNVSFPTKKVSDVLRGEGTSSEKTQIPKNSKILRRGALVDLPGFNLDYTQDIPRIYPGTKKRPRRI
jgi:hypothetical protein